MENRSGLLIVCATLFFTIIQWFSSSFNRIAVEAKPFLAPPPEYIERFPFGFQNSLADSLWLRWIQDSDNCQTYLKPVQYLKDQDKDRSEFYNPRHKNCDNSWSFKMLDAVTKMDPRFKMPYVAGGISLSILTEDYAGASIIFDRGLEAYPNDWDLLYRSAYHYLFDVGNKIKAAELLERASHNGAPAWVNSLAARLASEAGQYELGLRTLFAYRKTITDNPRAAKEVDERIAVLKQKLIQSRQKQQ